jgi:hypothetical protein
MQALPGTLPPMEEPTGPELAQRLRDAFPELDLPTFAEDLEPMSESGAQRLRAMGANEAIVANVLRSHLTRCAALTAFSHQFKDWVEQGKSEPVLRALLLMDQLLAEAPPVPAMMRADEVGDQFHNSLLVCFFENIMNTTAAFRTMVRPNLGPAIRRHLQEHEPFWLED